MIGRSWIHVRTIAGHTVGAALRERTASILAALFLALVLVSAYLGWSATATVNAIYDHAVVVLGAAGQTIPDNPVHEISPLSLLRNMATYVSLIGALAAIVIGFQMVANDRKSGILPLVGTRPVSPLAFAVGKLLALCVVLCGLVLFAAAINSATFVLLPEFHLSGGGWLRLVAFYGVSVLYMLFFGFMALAFATASRSESVGLLAPVSIWLTLTFIVPQLTSNINPTAALNPLTALAAAPDLSFFDLASAVLGPISVTEAYRVVAAQLLDFLPLDFARPLLFPPIATMLIGCMATASISAAALMRKDMTEGDFDA